MPIIRNCALHVYKHNTRKIANELKFLSPLEKSIFLKSYNTTVFECGSGDIIWSDRVCDMNYDCRDKSDELNCTSSKSKF